MAASVSFALANRMEEIPRLIEHLEAFGAQAGLGDDVVFRITVTLDEVVTNIVRYAFDDDRPHEIVLHLTEDGGLVTAVVQDDGRAFDPRTVPPADIQAPVELRPIGGLGVHLVRSMTRSLDYRREGLRNVLTMTFEATSPTH